MIFTELSLPGVFLISQEPIRDERGEFARVFCVEEFRQAGFLIEFPQENRSVCKHAGTLRGLHLQLPPHGECKVLRCTRGKIFDVAVDCRKGSPHFLKWVGIELAYDDGKMVLIPPGFAHGYQALTDGAEATYRASVAYHPESERQVRFDDPRVGISWPIETPILSPKDASTAFLTDQFSGFEV